MQDKSPTKHPANAESSGVSNAAAVEPIAPLSSAESLPPVIPDAATHAMNAAPIVAATDPLGKSDRLIFLDHHQYSFINLLAYQISSQTGTFESYLNESEKHLNSKNLTPAMEKIFLDQLDEEFKERARLEALTLAFHAENADKKNAYERDKGSLLLQFKIRVLRDKTLKAYQDFDKQEKYLTNLKEQFEKGAGGALNIQVIDFFNKAIKQKINREKEHYEKTHITAITKALSWSFKESWQWTKDRAKSFWGFLSDVYVRDPTGNYISSNKDDAGNFKTNSIKEIDKNGKPLFTEPRKISALKVTGRVLAGVAIVAAISGIVVGVVAATHGLGVAAAPAAIAAPALASTLIGTSTGMGISAGAIAGITAGIAAVAAIGTFIGVKLQKISDNKNSKESKLRRAQIRGTLETPSDQDNQNTLSASPAPSAPMSKKQYEASKKAMQNMFYGASSAPSLQKDIELSQQASKKSSDKKEPRESKTPSSRPSKP